MDISRRNFKLPVDQRQLIQTFCLSCLYIFKSSSRLQGRVMKRRAEDCRRRCKEMRDKR